MSAGPAAGGGAAPIRVRELTFTYPRTTEPALRGVDFEVSRGEILGFLGPSGAGKSTTQKILVGLLAGYSGSVSVLGIDRARWRPRDYRRIGVSFEAPNHFLKLTALENLRHFAALHGGSPRDPHRLLERLELAGAAGRRVADYSKGMKTRLGVARALLHEPELLFLDEPTVGLDPVNARRVRDVILEERGAGRTVFLTTHDMAIADELCDRIALIVDGQLRRLASPRALKLEYGERRVLVEFGEPDGGRGRRAFPLDGLGEDGEFAELLRSGRVETIHTQEATLQDVFIRVTGRPLP